MTADEIKKEFKYYYSNIHRPGADRLMGYIEQEGFFEAPASRKFHENYPGGLAEHSVNVTRNIMELGDRYRYWFGYSSETLALVGLLHDLCKMGAYKMDEEEYVSSHSFPAGHGEKSVFMILRFMELTEEEILAIRWHMGGFDHAVVGGCRDQSYAYDQSALAVMLHIADMKAAHLDERGDIPKI